MSGPINPQAIPPFSGGPIPLTRGLDISSPPGKAEPGTLRDCLNFEVVDGQLQQTMGSLHMGKTTFNSIKDLYILLGDSSSGDYTQTGSITAREQVKWYPDSTSLNQLQGEGYWLKSTVDSRDYIALFHTSGAAPTTQSYFLGVSSGAEVTVDDDDYRFSLPDDNYYSLSEQVYENAISTMFTNIGESNTWDAFRPSPLTAAIQSRFGSGRVSHLFQCNDNLYAVVDFPVVGYQSGTAKPSIGDKIHVDYPNATGPIGYVAYVEELQGDWEDGDQSGWIYLYPQSDGTLDPDKWANVTSMASGNTIRNLTTSVSFATGLTQTGNNDVKVHKFHGQVWKLNTAEQVNTGWSWVHPCYSVRFGNDDTSVDQTAPATEIAPLFTTDGVSTLADTGSLAFNTPTEEPASGGTLSAWSNLTNLVSDDTSYATSTPLAGDATRKLNFTVAASTAIPDTAKITGIEVTFEAFAAATDVVYCSVAQLRNDAAASRDDGYNRVWDVSENRGRSIEDPLTASPAVFTIGGDLDLWGLEEIPIADWNNQDIELDLQFANTDASSRLVSVDYVWIKVYYTVNSKHVYFVRDGSDITEGTIFAYQVHDGDWSTEDASGFLSFDSVDDPGAVLAGDAIWTGTGGTGSFIGNVRSIGMNLLPSYDEMRLAGTRSRTKISSLASDDGEETAYCVNGVGPAWAIDADDRLRMIRTPVSPEKDKPRYVEEHRNHLVLGLKEHFIVSAINSPDVMTTFDGATTWHVRDRITGLHHTTDNTTVVLCRDSIHQFQGASASGQDPFSLSTITSRGGAKDYSSVAMGDIYFMTSHGLSTLGATDKFGNFDAAVLSKGVEDWLRERLLSRDNTDGVVAENGLIDCHAVMSKNQIRFYFNDGWVLVATIDPSGQRPPEFTFLNHSAFWTVDGAGRLEGGSDWGPWNEAYNQPATAVHASFTSWGEEKIYAAYKDDFAFSSNLADVYRLEQGASANGATTVVNGFIELNPISFSPSLDTPSQLDSTVLTWDVPARSQVNMFVGEDFRPPYVPGRDTASSLVTRDPSLLSYPNGTTVHDEYTGHRQVYVATCHTSNYSIAHSWTVVARAEPASVNKPMRLISLTPMVQPRTGHARAQTETSYGASLPRRK